MNELGRIFPPTASLCRRCSWPPGAWWPPRRAEAPYGGRGGSPQDHRLGLHRHGARDMRHRKNLVKIMLEGSNIRVYDLGADVPPEEFVRAARGHGCTSSPAQPC